MNSNDLNETYKKIPWIYEMSEVFQNNLVVIKRLDKIPEYEQQKLVYAVVSTLSKYFSQIPDHNAVLSMSDPDYSVKFEKILGNMLPNWLSGLCDLTIAQIINGLLDIINLKTQYNNWPPKSVMDFYSVCKQSRAPYHDYKNPNNYKQIEHDKDAAWEKSKGIAAKHLSDMFKVLGKDYEKIRAKKMLTSKIQLTSCATEIDNL